MRTYEEYLKEFEGSDITNLMSRERYEYEHSDEKKKELSLDVKESNPILGRLMDERPEIDEFMVRLIFEFGLRGMDWGDVLKYVKGRTKFKFLKFNIDELDNYLQEIRSADDIILVLDVSNTGCLDNYSEVEDIIYQKENYCFGQIYNDKNLPDDEILIKILLMD
jgi:hypothetical protein